MSLAAAPIVCYSAIIVSWLWMLRVSVLGLFLTRRNKSSPFLVSTRDDTNRKAYRYRERSIFCCAATHLSRGCGCLCVKYACLLTSVLAVGLVCPPFCSARGGRLHSPHCSDGSPMRRDAAVSQQGSRHVLCRCPRVLYHHETGPMPTAPTVSTPITRLTERVGSQPSSATDGNTTTRATIAPSTIRVKHAVRVSGSKNIF